MLAVAERTDRPRSVKPRAVRWQQKQAISCASRRARVAACLALMTHQVAVLRYDAGCCSKNASACAVSANCARSWAEKATSDCSNAYPMDFASVRAS